jgi:hypothetical protein
MSKAIEMSKNGLAEWQAALHDLKIDSYKDLTDAVYAVGDEIAPQTAKKAFRGEGIERPQWIKVFKALDLRRETFFSEYEWENFSSLDLWKKLWDVAEDANDRFGLVLPQRPQEGNIRDALIPQKYATIFPDGTNVFIEIPAGLTGSLILLERNTRDEIDLVAPSCLMQDTFLNGELQRLPQQPSAPVLSIPLRSPGTRYLWAGIFAELPGWQWLIGAEKEVLALEVKQLAELLAFAKNQSQGTKIWRSSYTVTAA